MPVVPLAAQVLSDIEAKYPLLTKEQRFVFAVQTLVQEYGYPAEQAKSEVKKLLD
ncbi:hypothetical protein FACS189454_08700 [Planctomycetales bacterium]|nr:hypothetical protein FACS189454_08700 [Planctomycetales bacterium]